jgi:hypothetical protein
MLNDQSLVTPTLARLYVEQGHLRQAAQIYRHLLEKSPDRSDYLKALAEIENRLTAEALQTDQALIRLIAKWIDLEMSYAKLKQFKALRLNRSSHREKTDNHVYVDIV